MLNYETLLSSYDDKLTLMQWLKKVEAALKDASAVGFDVNKKGDATLTFSITFEDGSKLESGEIVLQQGESVESAAIVNGHLILTLTNGDELDAGQLLNGDLNVSGNLAATGKITGAEIVENMTGYVFNPGTSNFSPIYVGVVKNGNKLTFTAFGSYTHSGTSTDVALGSFTIPANVGSKLIPYTSGGLTSVLEQKTISAFKDLYTFVTIPVYVSKYSNTSIALRVIAQPISDGATYYIRYEATFLLSDNLAA